MIFNKKEDLVKYKSEIKQFLEEDIASRYYFQKGRLEASLKDDSDVKEAITILNDSERYKKILSTIVKSEKPLYKSEKEKQKNLKKAKGEVEN